MRVFIITEDRQNDEPRNVACFGTKEDAKEFCLKHNKSDRHWPFDYEEWEVGDVIDELKQL